MEQSKWYNLTPDELKSVVNGPKNYGLKGSFLTFIIVVVNVLPLFFRYPIKFSKAYINSVLNNFIKN